MKRLFSFSILFMICSSYAFPQLKPINFRWTKLSTEYGDVILPNKGKIQTACIAADFTKNGKDEFVIVEKTTDPSVILYMHVEGRKWDRYEIEKRKIDASEAIAVADIDGDGDLDLCIGGGGKEIWWWENPYPNYNASKQWKRNYIKRSGSDMHNDLAFGDFDGDNELEIAFWNQGENALYVAEKPADVGRIDDWPRTLVYSYPVDGQMEQHSGGTELAAHGINYHDGIGVADINGDGVDDILAGGMWLNFSGGKYIANLIDGAYTSSRIQAGQLIAEDRPEVVMTSTDGVGPMIMYQYEKGVWKQTILQKNLRGAHSLILVDFDKDGDIDIISGEMRTKEVGDPKVFLLLNDGNANFTRLEIDSGKGVHFLSLGDIDGDGDYDLVGKPFAWDTPRIDLWLNDGIK